MIKLKNSVFTLVKNEKININCVKTEDAIKIHSDKMNTFLDIRNIREITKSGRILGAKYLPIVILEFWVDTKSKFHKKFLNKSFNFIFCCHSDWGLALATLAVNNIAFLNTSNLIDGYNRILGLSDPIEEAW